MTVTRKQQKREKKKSTSTYRASAHHSQWDRKGTGASAADTQESTADHYLLPYDFISPSSDPFNPPAETVKSAHNPSALPYSGEFLSLFQEHIDQMRNHHANHDRASCEAPAPQGSTSIRKISEEKWKKYRKRTRDRSHRRITNTPGVFLERSTKLEVDFDLSKDAAHRGHKGIPVKSMDGDRDCPTYIHSLEGRHALLLDRSGKVFAVRASAPTGPESHARLMKIEKAIEELAKAFPEKKAEVLRDGATKRSTWPITTATWGFTCGPGMDYMDNRKINTLKQKRAIVAFRTNHDVRGWASHIARVWNGWFPKLKIHYSKVLDALVNQYGPQDPEFRLTPPFESIPFACCTVNLGPQTITPLHRDSENLSYGICVISSFGKYDWRKGGELFLLEPNVLLQMRPGDVVLMPSALITHGNMPLSSPSEVRYSITMYSAGRLFECWYCRSKESNNLLEVEFNDQGKAKVPSGLLSKEEKEEVWKIGLEYYNKL